MKTKIKNENWIKNATLNRRRAIRRRCLDCSAGIPSEVKNCSHSNCSLYFFRAGKGRQDAATRKKAIRIYCLDCMNDQAGTVSKCPSSECPLFVYRKGNLEKPIEARYFEKIRHIECCLR